MQNYLVYDYLSLTRKTNTSQLNLDPKKAIFERM